MNKQIFHINTYKSIALVLLCSAVVMTKLSCAQKAETTIPEESKMNLHSNSFADSAIIPNKYTCSAAKQVFPHISWTNVKTEVKSFVLIMDDPDAIPVAGYTWQHWALYDIPASVNALEEGTDVYNPLPAAVKRGKTSFGDTAYGGPCPPLGQNHRYFFRLYGINTESLTIGRGATVAEIKQAMAGKAIDSAFYNATFSR